MTPDALYVHIQVGPAAQVAGAHRLDLGREWVAFADGVVVGDMILGLDAVLRDGDEATVDPAELQGGHVGVLVQNDARARRSRRR